MFDLETLSTRINTVVLTLGGVKFDPYTKEEPTDPIYLKFDADWQILQGRHYDDDTLRWWGRQSEEIQEEAMGEEGRVSIDEGLRLFRKWVWNSDTVWSNGSIFDVMIMENLCEQNNAPVPWNYWDIRDVRTVFDMSVNPRMDKKDLHNALADAYQQAIGVQNVFCELGITKWPEEKANPRVTQQDRKR